MNEEKLTEKLADVREKQVFVEGEIKSIIMRLDRHEDLTLGIHKIASNVESLTTQVKHLAERLDRNVTTLHSRVDENEAKNDTRFKEQGERLGELERKPAKRFDGIVTQIIGLVVALIFGLVVAKVGLGV